MAREGHVIEANHCALLGHALAGFAQRQQHTRRRLVIAGKNRITCNAIRQQALHGSLAMGSLSVVATVNAPSDLTCELGSVDVRLTPRSDVTVTATCELGEVKVAGTARATLKKGKKKTVTIKLGKAGKKLAKSCGKPKLTVTSTTKSGKKQKQSGKTKRTLKKSASLCGPKVVPVPSTIDLTTAERCDFITEGADPRTECLFPYPNNYFTKADSATDTGLRLDLKRDSMPANKDGVRINPADINMSDGFSPGAPIITQVPGLDNQAAFDQSGIVSIKEKSSYADADQPIVVIDAATGEREPIWAELDANATSAEQTDLEIHLNKNLIEGHRYIVAMRDLRRSDGSTIEAPDGFKLYRTENQVTNNSIVEARRAKFEEIFTKLGYIDNQFLAPRIKAGVLMFTGLMDTICPPSTQFAAYNKITSPKDVVIYPDHGHEGLPGASDMVFEFMMGL